jgi:uncharacterized membrane protein
MPEAFKLVGLLIAVVGLLLRLRTTMVVVVAALVTGLISGMPLFSTGGAHPVEGLLDVLGRAFVENRLMSLFLLTLPVIGLSERHGLQRQSARLMSRLPAASPGRLILSYQLFRVVHGILGIRLNGHALFVRPLIYPMASAAGRGSDAAVERRSNEAEAIKAATAASENYGNFYGQNLSPVQPGVLFTHGLLTGFGCQVSLLQLVHYTAYIAAGTVALAALQFRRLDRWLRQQGE